MLLSFSLDEMLPGILWGIVQGGDLHKQDGSTDPTWDRARTRVEAAGGTWPDASKDKILIKRQTIREWSGLERSPYRRVMPGDGVDLWYKSRAPKIGFKLGCAKLISVRRVIIQPGRVKLCERRDTVALALGIPIPNPGSWMETVRDPADSEKFAALDGFQSADDFFDHFLPEKKGKRPEYFEGIMLQW